ncbi:MAG TPA: vanadium-dependent haloperoxidase [Candidatus Binataceae bacterium]|nr:vanadium-dependent haloperoxidase [Candidatus Binataceae bacterium]
MLPKDPATVSTLGFGPKEASSPSASKQEGLSRRSFIGRVGMVSVAAGVLGAAGGALAEPADATSSAAASTNLSPSISNPRVRESFALRVATATQESQIPVPPHTTNGDEQRYSDKSASYSKGLLQDDIGVVNPAAWLSFKKALNSGKNSDFEAMIIGGTRTQNGPQGAYAFDLCGSDSAQFGNAPSPGDPAGLPVVPPFDQISSSAYGTQLIEMYWASMLRDVAFTDYIANSTAAAAAAELGAQTDYRGPRDGSGNVTPNLLFRGNFPGETVGPYMSQLMITPTALGQLSIDQLLTTYLPGIDYMTDTTTFFKVQNGIDTGLRNQPDSVLRYLHDGRGLAAYTHIDVLYQEYLIALLVLGTLNTPVNPGNPYVGSRTQNSFCTFGGPDVAAALGTVATRALQRVWWQKWLVHLIHRPEAGGGVVQQILSGNQSKIEAHLASNILNSRAVAQSFSQHGTYLLSQAFPEGSPTHPSYPTGHGTVGGACITMLKFFFDESYVIPNPLVPSSDGLSLVAYTGSDAGAITIGGELNKLARNVSFGHGVHAGIHWRKDTDWSLTLGEAVAISYLRDMAPTYHEKFSITFTKLDGNPVTITNE